MADKRKPNPAKSRRKKATSDAGRPSQPSSRLTRRGSRKTRAPYEKRAPDADAGGGPRGEEDKGEKAGAGEAGKAEDARQSEAKTDSKADAKAKAHKDEPKPEPKAEAKPEPAPKTKADDKPRAGAAKEEPEPKAEKAEPEPAAKDTAEKAQPEADAKPAEGPVIEPLIKKKNLVPKDPDSPAPPPGLAPPGDSRSFRRHREGSEEFVFIYRDGSFLITRAGVVGKEGHWEVVEYPHQGAASHAYALKCSELTGDGFYDLRS